MAKSGEHDEKAPLLPQITTSGETAPLAAEDGHAQLTDISQTTFNMINCFVGAGILTVPFAFRLAGYSACILVLFVAGLNWYTSLLLGKALDIASDLHPEIPLRSWNMGALAKAAFGPGGDHGIRLIFGLELWFALESFLVLTGMSVNLLTGIPETPVIIAAGTIGCLSLGLPLKALSQTSFLAVACMVAGLLALVVCGFGRMFDHPTNEVASAEKHHVLQLAQVPAALSIFLYCFSGLPCLPTIRAGMQKPKEEYPKAVHLTFAYSALYYLAVGMLGYEFFANDTRRSFLKDLVPIPGEGHAHVYGYIAAAAAGLFAVKLQAGFPLYAGPILDAVGLRADQGFSFKQVMLGRSMFCIVSVLFAIVASSRIDAVAELMGAFLTNSTSIIFPVAAYFSLTAGRGQKLDKASLVGLSCLLMFGVVYGIVGTVSATKNIWFGRALQLPPASMVPESPGAGSLIMMNGGSSSVRAWLRAEVGARTP
jgi:amino acid permease